MGCAFSQESEDSRYRRKIQHQGQKGIQSNRNRSPHQRPQRSSSQQQSSNAAAGRVGTPNNVYGPVVAKTATVNTRGSRTVTPVAVPPTAPAKANTSPLAAGSSSAADGGGTPAKASEPEDIHFRRQHFDRNSVLRHSKKRSRKASSPYATAASNANKSDGGEKSKEDAGGGGSGVRGGGSQKEEKAEIGNNSSSSNTSIKENSSAAANRSSSMAAPKRNATTISISDDGSSRVITNGEDPSPCGEKEQNRASASSLANAEDSRLNKQQISSFSPQKRRTSETARARMSSAELNAPRKTSYDNTNRDYISSPTSTGTRTFRTSEQSRMTATAATTRQRRSSRQEQENQQKDVIMAEDKSDECGRLI